MEPLAAPPRLSRAAAVAVVVTLIAVGCRGADRDDALDDAAEILVDDRPEATAEVERDFAPALNVDLARMTRTESGLYYEDVAIGEGAVAEVGRHVEVHYRGWLPDGSRLESSYESNEPIDFVLGTGEVISGWEEGLLGMREGGRRRLVIPPSLGYGRDGLGMIPPYATLVFETELVRVQ
jgi:FKBP-type peptidyl-prolyl cis-trans isomerase FkpA